MIQRTWQKNLKKKEAQRENNVGENEHLELPKECSKK